MRRFRADKKWTKESCEFLSAVMKEAGDRTLEGKGMFTGGSIGFYGKNPMASGMWPAIASNAAILFHSAGKRPEYMATMNGLFTFLTYYGIERREHNKIWSVSPKEDLDISAPLNYLGRLGNQELPDPDMKDSLDRKVKEYNYKEFIEFANLMDLSNATECACEHANDIMQNANRAMDLIESSYRASGNNSNISGLMYKELNNLVINMGKLQNGRVQEKDLKRLKRNVAVSMDRLDLLTTKYLDHKSKGFNANAVDKIKAAALIKNMVKYCYHEADTIAAVDQFDAHQYMENYKNNKYVRLMEESGVEDSIGVIGQLASNDRAVRAEEVVHDSTLKQAIAHKGEEPKVEEPFLQMR